MMDMSSPHLGFVLASYGLFGFVLAGLLAYALWRGGQLKRALKQRGLNDPGRAAINTDQS